MLISYPVWYKNVGKISRCRRFCTKIISALDCVAADEGRKSLLVKKTLLISYVILSVAMGTPLNYKFRDKHALPQDKVLQRVMAARMPPGRLARRSAGRCQDASERSRTF